MKPVLSGISLLALCFGTPTIADDIFTDDISAQAGVCVGDDCLDDETFDLVDFDSQLRMKGSFLRLEFNDISGSSSPDRDWALRANEKGGGAAGEAFFLEDLTAATTPLYVQGGAPSNALFVAVGGNVGLGTSLPQRDLHLATGSSPGIRFETTAATPMQIWDLVGGNAAMGFLNVSGGNTIPFAVSVDAPTDALRINQFGNVGIGTNLAEAPLELSRDETFNFFRITATGAAINRAVDIVFTEGPLGTGQLRYNIVEGSGTQTPEMTLDADGNMVLTGTLTTAGPTCAAGCDRVFDEGYALPSIADHSDAMYDLGHLPSVGPTVPDVPLNVTEKMAGMLNALEHAHIYIDQLNGKIETLETLRVDDARREAALLERLTLIEAQLAQ